MANSEDVQTTEFSWANVEKRELITPSVGAIAVYRNPNGDVVIRQEDRLGDEDDVVVVPMDRVELLVLRLNELLEEAQRDR